MKPIRKFEKAVMNPKDFRKVAEKHRDLVNWVWFELALLRTRRKFRHSLWALPVHDSRLLMVTTGPHARKWKWLGRRADKVHAEFKAKTAALIATVNGH
jgi:hypothetical protein